ncbi:MAG: hypothetical protein RLZZ312_442 [Bacteroidota bacterium]|jgi:hypothetical protein
MFLTLLQAHQNFNVKTQNKDVASPIYDLCEFENINSSNLPQAAIENLTVIVYNLKSGKSKNFWNSKLFLWFSRGFVGLVILFFVKSFLKQIQ